MPTTAKLPPGWAWTTLGEVCLRVTDGSHSTPEFVDEGFPFVTITHVDSEGNIDFDSASRISAEDFAELARNDCRPRLGDVLFSKDGTVGKVSIVDYDKDFAILSSLALLRPNSALLNQRYLAHVLRSASSLAQASSRKSGSALRRIILRELSKVRIPLPPLPEQRRIVAKIEELFSQLDAGVEELKKAKAQLKRYRQSVLKAAFEGKLTEEWRRQRANRQEPIETAQELLARIREERKKALGRKYKEPLPLDTSDLSVLPEGWAWANAHQLTLFITDGEHITPERADSGVLLLSARNVLDGRLSLDKVDYVPEQVYERLCTRLRVTAGDVLLSCSGSVGRSCAAPVMPRFALVRSVAVLRPLFEMGNYMSYALRTPLLQSQIVEKKTQTAQANIFQGKIAALLFPVAPLEEQRTIVSEIESRLSIADAEEKAIEAALKQAARLRQSILKRAFEGRLVPQDPTDEPAGRLLERIRAEKAKREAGQPRGRGRRTATAGK